MVEVQRRIYIGPVGTNSVENLGVVRDRFNREKFQLKLDVFGVGVMKVKNGYMDPKGITRLLIAVGGQSLIASLSQSGSS